MCGANVPQVGEVIAIYLHRITDFIEKLYGDDFGNVSVLDHSP